MSLEGGADNAVELDLSAFADGTEVTWMVRTQGAVEGVWSPWSAAQAFLVVEPPVAGISLADGAGGAVDASSPLTSLPLAVSVSLGGTASNPPVELHVEVVALEGHGSAADDGSDSYVAAGEAVYSRYFTADDGLGAGGFSVEVPASEIRLDDAQAYAARAVAATAMGLRAEAEEVPFAVEWGGELPAPVADVAFDAESLTVSVSPACYAAGATEEPDGEQRAGEAVFTFRTGSLPASFALPPGAVYVSGVSASVPDADGEPLEVPSEWAWDEESRSLEVASLAYGGDDTEASVAVSYIAMGDGTALPEVVGEAGEGADDDAPDVPSAAPLSASEVDLISDGGAVEADGEGERVADYSDGDDGDGGDAVAEGATLLDGVTLDVYRIAYDGEAVRIASGLPNDGQASCTDPHPPFGAASYRVVAHDSATDAQSFSEYEAEVPVGHVVLTTPWGDVAMPYGLSLTESHGIDSEAVAFSGRRRKVAFFGTTATTQATQSASVLARLGGGELAALRRLAHAPALGYLRDPSGLAFWAVCRVSVRHAGAGVSEVTLEYEMVDAPEGEVG